MSNIAQRPLRGLRVLVAEDELLLSEAICEILCGLECTVIGPFDNLDDTLRAIRTNGIDAALLDIQLGKENVYPAAKELALQRIPFILLSGYTSLSGYPALFHNAALLTKPFDVRQLEYMMRSIFSPREVPHQP